MPCALTDEQVGQVLARLPDDIGSTAEFVAACPHSGGARSGVACPVVRAEKRAACEARLVSYARSHRGAIWRTPAGGDLSRWTRGGGGAIRPGKRLPARTDEIDGFRVPVMLAVVECMAERFSTRDQSIDPEFSGAHPALAGERNYHARVGAALGKLTHPDGSPLLARLDRDPKLGQRWERARAGTKAAAGGAQPVRPEHFAALDYMETAQFAEVRAVFERHPDVGGAYFRPAYNSITVVDLHPSSPRPLVGVGEAVRLGTHAFAIEQEMPERVAGLKQFRAAQKEEKVEARLEARLVRGALAGRLALPGFPERLRFLHSQWRMEPEPGKSARVADLVAVDLARGRLVVIELKAAADTGALAQAAEYVAYFRANAPALCPFFARLARIMGRLYDCPEVAAVSGIGAPATALAAWPARGDPAGVVIEGLDALDRD
ncbi:MAG: hypothetical protein FJ087_04155 [Deltaproteobacteria bacterium]|nr:hypothetical protein [Deltaproteobacteria bacterium]